MKRGIQHLDAELGAPPSYLCLLGFQEPIEADDDDEELPDADAELAELARLRNQALAAHREAAGLMEGGL